MTITVNTPDGGTASFPDDTSKDDITSAMKAKFGSSDGQAAPAIDDSTSGIVGNALYRAVNSGTLHGLDYLTAGAHAVERGTGIDPNATDLSQIRSQNDEFASKHPIWAMGADIAPWLIPGYGEALGVGKAAELASSLGAGARTARVLGGAAENAALSGASTLTGGGSVGDALKAATIGSVVGGATGALPAGRTVPTTPTTGDLLAQAQSKFTPLENTRFHPAGFERAMTDTSDAMSAGDRQTMSASLSGKIDDITKETQSGSTLTADDVAKFQRSLMKAARGPQDQRIAGDFIDALDQRLGPVAGDVADANRATNIAKTSRDIDKWATNPETAPKTVAAALAKRPDLYKAQPGLYEALDKIGQLSQPPTLMQKLGQHAISSGLTAATGAGLDYVMGGNPASGAVQGALTGLLYPHIAAARRAGPIKNKLAAARHLAATGQALDPSVFAPPSPKLAAFGGLARNASLGLSASGDY